VFEPAHLQYTQQYENSLFFSPRFQDYAQSQVARLIERYNLHDKNVIEIGCGKGDFLLLLCELGTNNGVGFDPTYIEQEKHNEMKNRVKFIQDFYSEKYENYQADLIVCRHVLEHIQNPKNFLNMLRRTIGNRPNTYLFFEVPNAQRIFHNLFVWDIIYEHCSYFSPNALSFTFSSCDFQVCELTEEFEGQFLCIDAQPDKQGAPIPDLKQQGEVNQIASDIKSFVTNYRSKVETIRHELEQLENKGGRVVAWGAGSKGVTFLNIFKNRQIDYAVDINPRKQGMYIPGTGQRIVPPDFLRDYHPDVIIIMNPIYRTEIQELTKRLGLTTKFMFV